MKRPLDQLRSVAEHYTVPIICAGDVFDKWNSPPELVNFALENLPKMYSIPGQHDLPYHDYEQIHKSAYWTLVKAGILKNLKPGKPQRIDSFLVEAFPWGFDPTSLEYHEEITSLAVVHKYVWMVGSSYEGAPDDGKINRFRSSIAGFTAAVVGDNHKGFLNTNGMTAVFNCGGFMVRKSDESSYCPRIGLLTLSGKIIPIRLDTSEDKYLDCGVVGETILSGMGEYLKSLKALSSSEKLDFVGALRRCLDGGDIRKEVANAIIETLEEKESDE